MKSDGNYLKSARFTSNKLNMFCKREKPGKLEFF